MSDNKKSWKEIDAARDRAGVKPAKKLSEQEKRAQNLVSKEAKKELEAMFSGSKMNKRKAELLAGIKGVRGKSDFQIKINSYIEEFGDPLEWDVQLTFLDSRDSRLVIRILELLKKTAPLEDLSKQELLNQKLRVMALSTFDSELIDKISEVQKNLLKT